ncbi:MAG: type VI secretion system baseplate subunit TssG, partial [Gemmatimonadaceae bacterium]
PHRDHSPAASPARSVDAALRLESAPVTLGAAGAAGGGSAGGGSAGATEPDGGYAPPHAPATTAPGHGAYDGGGRIPPELSVGALRALEKLLSENPTSIEFFQAVRLLERMLPERDPVGGFGDPAREVARFAVPPSISFPASEIQWLRLDEGGGARIGINFIGLTGPLGVLPYSYTLAVAERARQRDTAARDFLDMFHHRITSLFYRAWERYRFTVAHERDQRDPLARHVADLIGMGTAGLQGRLGVDDASLLFYGGLLSSHRRSAAGLEQLLSDYFSVTAAVEQFVGDWYPLRVSDQCALDHESTAPSARLGLGAVVGDEVWDPQARVRIRLGPLARAQYDDFLPGGTALPRLRELVRLYTDDQLDVELQLVLARDDVPACVLGTCDDVDGGAGDAGGLLPLGWTTWLRTTASTHDRDDAVFVL